MQPENKKIIPPPMSLVGQARRLRDVRSASAIPPFAAIRGDMRVGRNVPQAAITTPLARVTAGFHPGARLQSRIAPERGARLACPDASEDKMALPFPVRDP